MPTISPELLQAVQEAGNTPVRLDNPETRAAYFLLTEEVYERVRSLIEAEEDFGIRDAYPLMDRVASAEGWDNPEMDVYNRYEPPQ